LFAFVSFFDVFIQALMPGESSSLDKPTSSSASTRDELPHSSSSPQQGDKPEDETSNEANGGAGYLLLHPHPAWSEFKPASRASLGRKGKRRER
jgi:hypothetical protein